MSLCFYERGALLAVFPVLECDGMKALPGLADINTNDNGTGLVLIHTDSSARQEARDRGFWGSKTTHGSRSDAILTRFLEPFLAGKRKERLPAHFLLHATCSVFHGSFAGIADDGAESLQHGLDGLW